MNLSDLTIIFADSINKQRQFIHEMFTNLMNNIDTDIEKLQVRKNQISIEWQELDNALAGLISPTMVTKEPVKTQDDQ